MSQHRCASSLNIMSIEAVEREDSGHSSQLSAMLPMYCRGQHYILCTMRYRKRASESKTGEEVSAR